MSRNTLLRVCPPGYLRGYLPVLFQRDDGWYWGIPCVGAPPVMPVGPFPTQHAALENCRTDARVWSAFNKMSKTG